MTDDAVSRSPAPTALELKSRRRVLDGSWLLLYTCALGVVFVPWVAGYLTVEMGLVTGSLFGAALVHTSLGVGLDQSESVAVQRFGALALPVLGTLFLGVFWIGIGGSRTLLFAPFFVLPVVAAGATAQPSHPWLLAAVSSAVLVTVGVLTSPDLLWLVDRMGVPGAHAAWEAFGSTERGASVFTGTELSAYGTASVLFGSGFAILAAAWATSTTADQARGAHARSLALRQAATQYRGLAESVFRAAPHPSVLMEADSGRIVWASDSFASLVERDAARCVDSSLLELFEFTRPDRVSAAIASGEPIRVSLRSRQGHRVVGLTARAVEHEGVRYAYVTITDQQALDGLQRTLDADPDGHVLIDHDNRIAWVNRAARTMFGEPRIGAPATVVLDTDEVPRGWWDPGPRSKHTRSVSIAGRDYLVQLLAVRLDGSSDRLTAVRLHPVSS